MGQGWILKKLTVIHIKIYNGKIKTHTKITRENGGEREDLMGFV